MLRLILIAVFLVLYLLVSIPIIGIEMLIGLFNKDIKKRSSLAIVSWGFKVIIFLAGIKTTVIGEENVPKDEPVFYIANHRSFFDVVVSYARVPRPTGYIAKKEILKVPVLSWWMRILDCLFMDRKDVRQSAQVIFDAIDKIKAGTSICIYPEGTRNTTEEDMLPFHKGSFKPAQRTNCPIVPVVVTNTREIFEDHLPFIKAQHITLEYLPPVHYNDLSKDDQKRINDYFHDQMLATYRKNLGKN